MRVLVACEYSGIVRDAFIRRGHDAISVDLLPSESDAGPHWQGDVFEFLRIRGPETFDLMVAHPPCTYLANSGVRWLTRHGRPANAQRWKDMVYGAVFFRDLLTLPVPRVAVENPIIHGHARAIIGEAQAQTIQPWQFGHGECKAICLWLRGLPPLVPTNVVEGREARVHRMPPSEDRGKERSRFYQGIADAMAAQWEDKLKEDA